MSFTQKDVIKLAHLARLDLDLGAITKTTLDSTEQDVTKQPLKHFAANITKDLNNILNMVAEISEIDTKHVEPMFHSSAMSQRLRNDEVTESNVVTTMQQIAPPGGAKNNLYIVPLVVE